MKGASFHPLKAGLWPADPSGGYGTLPTLSMWDGEVKLPGNPGLSTLEAGNRAVLAQQADLVKQIPQFVPVTGPFPHQIPPLEGDLSVVMSLLFSKLVILCHHSGCIKFWDNVCSSSTNAAFTAPPGHCLLNTCSHLCLCSSSLFAGVPLCLQAPPLMLLSWGSAQLSPSGAARGQAEQALLRPWLCLPSPSLSSAHGWGGSCFGGILLPRNGCRG